MHDTKITSMFQNSLLGYTSLSQWALFLGIASILFGIIEKRESFLLAGKLAFLAMGLMALWVLLTEVAPAAVVNEHNLSKELRVFVYFKSVALFSGFVALSILLKLFNFRFQKESVYIVLFFALVLFFMVFNIQQMID